MRRRYLPLIAVPMIAVAAVRHQAPHPDPKAAFIASARTAVADSLSDPLAAQFRALSVVTDGAGLQKVCGEVNAKNQYGGYVGFRAFAYIPQFGGPIWAPEDDDRSDDANTANRAGSGCPGFGNWHR